MPLRSKRPVIDAWQKLRLSAEDIPSHFSAPQNIGVLLGESSGHLVDVDLDTPQAIIAAHHVLPDTGCIFGRAGSQASHHLFVAETKTEQFKFDGVILVELRSTGVQTIMPGSVHVTGETIDWEVDNGPAEIDPTELRRAVAKVAALASHWPTTGRREATLALSGGLKRSQWTKDFAIDFVRAITDAAADEEQATA